MKLTSILLAFLFSVSLYARDFKIEEDIVFKTLVQALEKGEAGLGLYQESENYRFDLTLIDVVDTVSVVTNRTRFSGYGLRLNPLIENNLFNFPAWFSKVKELADADEKFFDVLDRKLFVQLYGREALAILPEYKFIDFQKIKDIGLLRRIKRYNSFVGDPEGRGLSLVFEGIKNASFVTKPLTVAKLMEISERELGKIRKAYYQKYVDLMERQYRYENAYKRYENLRFRYSKKRKVAIASNGGGLKAYTFGKKLFKTLQSSPEKTKIQAYLDQELKEVGIIVPKQQGVFLLTPYFLEENLEEVTEALQEYTVEKIADVKDDEYLLGLRRWVKNNGQLISEKKTQWESSNDRALSLQFTLDKKPKRVEVLRHHDELEMLFPERPWMAAQNPDFVDQNGKKKYFHKRRFGEKFRSLFKSVTKLENILGVLAGTTVMVVSGGNYAFAMSTTSLVRKGVYTIKHDREIEEFLKEAPIEVVSAFLLGSGFSAGRLYKILALGAGQGALQSALTGQDVRTGAIVGAGISLVGYYLLPSDINRPMTKGFDAKSLRTNRYLEILEKTVKGSAQGALVATLTGESPVKGALFGAGYGALSASLTIWFYGTRYYPFKDYTDADIDEMISNENAYQNLVGRGGEYAIDRQLMLDANYRVGGALPKIITASITLPGNVAMSDSGFARLTTLTHEAHHLMQQHQSGVFGFYLFRYIPTALRTGYDGHPDENFLKDVIGSFKAG